MKHSLSLSLFSIVQLRALRISHVAKVLIQFETSFWPPHNPNIIIQLTSSPFNSFINLTSVHNGLPLLLCVVNNSDQAQHIESLSQQQISQLIEESLKQVFGSSVSKIVNVTVSQFATDPFISGSYSSIGQLSLSNSNPHNNYNHHKAVSHVVGVTDLLSASLTNRISFAGDYTAVNEGNPLKSAYGSGIREARRLADNLIYSVQYGQKAEKQFHVIRSAELKADDECCLCESLATSNNVILNGPLIYVNGRIVHLKCIQYAANVRSNIHFNPKQGEEKQRNTNNQAVDITSSYQKTTQWYNVSSALSNSLTAICSSCNSTGASIGCHEPYCHSNYHYACAKQTGWDFDCDAEGSYFLCSHHRNKHKAANPRITPGTIFNRSNENHPIAAAAAPKRKLEHENIEIKKQKQ
jgi:hypothetical protein